MIENRRLGAKSGQSGSYRSIKSYHAHLGGANQGLLTFVNHLVKIAYEKIRKRSY